MKMIPLVAAIAAITAMPTVAQSETQSSNQLEEVIVTAQKRDQSLQDVSVSITAITADLIKDEGVKQMYDLQSFAPGLTIKNTTGRSNPAISIRGIGMNDWNVNSSPSAAVHVDEVYLGSTAYYSSAIFDLARVEVLRGPQGTLYGRNATAGSINFVTVKPTEEFEAYAKVGYGNYNAYSIEGAMGGALADNLSARVSFIYSKSDGYQTNLGTTGFSTFPGTTGFTAVPGLIPAIPLTKKDDKVGGDNLYSGRAQFAWDASDKVSVHASLNGGKDKSEEILPKHTTAITAVGVPVEPGKYNRQDNISPEMDSSNYGGMVRVNVYMDSFTFTSITGYQEMERFRSIGDASPLRTQDDQFDVDTHQFTQELRLTSNAEGDLFWVGGLYYMDDEVKMDREFDMSDLLLTGAELDYTQTSDSWAAFGQVEYNLSEAFKLTLGIRYTDEDKNLDGVSRDVDPYGISLGGAVFREGSPVIYDKYYNDDNVSGKIGLDFIINEDVMAYASISSGYKSGGFDGSFVTFDAASEPFGDEELTSYEIGLKSSWLDRSLKLNAALFYYDFDGMQVNAVVDIGSGIKDTVLINAATAEVSGGEIELSWLPVDGLTVDLGLAYSDGELTKWKGDEDYKGNKLPDAPEMTGNARIAYRFGLMGDLKAEASTSVYYSDEKYNEVSNNESMMSDSYTLVNARLNIFSESETWKLGVWGRNLTDEAYVDHSAPGFGPDILVNYSKPKTYGIDLTYNW